MNIKMLIRHIRQTRLVRRLFIFTLTLIVLSLASRYVFLTVQHDRYAGSLAQQRMLFLGQLVDRMLSQHAEPDVVSLQTTIDTYNTDMLDGQVIVFNQQGSPLVMTAAQQNHRYLADLPVFPQQPKPVLTVSQQTLRAWYPLQQGYWLYVSHKIMPLPNQPWFLGYAMFLPMVLLGLVVMVLLLPLSRMFEHLRQLTQLSQAIDEQPTYVPMQLSGSEQELNGLGHALNRLSYRYHQARQSLHKRQILQSNLIDTSPELLLQTSASGRITFVNGRFEQVAARPREQLLGQSLVNVLCAVDPLQQPVLLKLSQAAQQVRMQVRFSGHRTVFDLCLNPLRSVDGQLSGYAGSLHNIHDYMMRIQHLQVESANTQKQLKEGQRILATMSHELRTPLNGILGMTQLLKETSLSAEQADYARTLYHSGQSMLRLVNDILDLAKLDAGRMQTEQIEFDLLEMLLDVSDLMVASAAQKSIEFVRFIHPDSPRFLLGDPYRSRQILLNLLSNAIKFTQTGYVGLLVQPMARSDVPSSIVDAYGVTAHQQWLRFQVVDTGVGIPVDQQADLFQFFAQADQSVSRRFGGTGLGLAISRGLAEAMHGGIELCSEAGKGTMFSLYLPFTQQNDTKIYHRPQLLQYLHLLVFDPLLINREGWQRLLAGFGVNGEVYADLGQLVTAVQPLLAKQIKPIVLIEYDLLEEHLLSDWVADHVLQQIHSVLMSRHPRRSIASRQLQGFQGFVLKPLRMEHVWAEVLSILDQETIVADEVWPVQTAEEQSNLITAFFASLPEAVSEGDGQLHVLLAEDNVVNQKVASKMLQKLDCRVTLAENGQQAIDLLAAHTDIGLILMDCRMPEMDGLEATRQIRAMHNSVPIVALTANDTDDDRDACMAAGMDDFMPKPLDQQALGQLVRRFQAFR
ncbi:MAG: response regulator [Pseudomonadota bacterium]|nr:response regulator [Pseudomonadota bacterium]